MLKNKGIKARAKAKIGESKELPDENDKDVWSVLKPIMKRSENAKKAIKWRFKNNKKSIKKLKTIIGIKIIIMKTENELKDCLIICSGCGKRGKR